MCSIRPATPQSIDVLLLDLDDTLVQSEERNVALYREFMQQRGVRPDEADMEIVFGSAAVDIFSHLLAKYPSAFPESVSESEGLDAITTRFLVHKRRRLWQQPLQRAQGLDLLLALPQRKALVSGSFRNEIALVLESAGITEAAFEVILGNEDYRLGKPDPAGYLMALDAMGVAPPTALVVEDSSQGALAGRRAGCTVAFVAEFAHGSCDADLQFATLGDLAAWLSG